MKLIVALMILVWSLSLFFRIPGKFSLAAPLSESDSKKSQMRQIEKELSREKEQFLKYDFKEKNLLEQLSDIERDITEKRLALKEIKEKIRIGEGELKVHRNKVDRLEASLLELENLWQKRVVALYKYSRRGYLRILVNTNGLDRLNHMIKYLNTILDRDKEMMKQMADDQKSHREELSIIKKKVEDIIEFQEAEDKKLVSLEGDLDKKVMLLAKIHKEKEFYETAVKELQAAARNLKDTISHLEENRSKKSSLPTGFGNSKGRLPLPLPGKIVRDVNTMGDGRFDSQKGVYIRGDFGEEVRAVFPGRVDFSGQLKGYGQVIIINHGSRFFTISAYLLQRNKTKGDMVARGEVIGQVGETGLVTGPALYFEIREGETNLDPLKWLKVH